MKYLLVHYTCELEDGKKGKRVCRVPMNMVLDVDFVPQEGIDTNDDFEGECQDLVCDYVEVEDEV